MTLAKLTAQFRRLGVGNPTSLARSEIKEGIPQLARARVLYWMWSRIVGPTDTTWIERAIARYYVGESHRPGVGRARYPHVPPMFEALQAGISKKQLTQIAREAQIALLLELCVLFDGITRPPRQVGDSRFGIFELDAAGNPLKRLDGLHENFREFDRNRVALKKGMRASKS